MLRNLACFASCSLIALVCFADDDAPTTTAVEVVESDETLAVRVGEQLVLEYHMATSQPPEGIDAVFARSGHIHPITTPNGRVVTAEFPEDHAHQHGLFAAWVNTLHAGRTVDFWNQAGGTGDVRHAEAISTTSGDDFAEFEVRLEHIAKNDDSTTTVVLHENWNVRVYNRDDIHLFDITSRQVCVHDEPLHVLEYHYGGMAMRGPTAWLGGDEERLVTSEGLTCTPGNHSRPNWVAMTGILDDAECGIAVMQHPDNFRYPQPVRLHPDKPYFVYSPCVLGEFTLSKGDEPMVNRYRYVAFDGAVDADLIDRLCNEFAVSND